MVTDLNLPVEIVGAPLSRDPDGLASSSRNAYLSEEERAGALALPRALAAGREAASGGAEAVRIASSKVLEEAAEATPPVRLDYLALVAPATFDEVSDDHDGDAILAVAARVGATRLIDNIVVPL